MIDLNHKHTFPVCRQADIIPLKSKLYYDEPSIFLKKRKLA